MLAHVLLKFICITSHVSIITKWWVDIITNRAVNFLMFRCPLSCGSEPARPTQSGKSFTHLVPSTPMLVGTPSAWRIRPQGSMSGAWRNGAVIHNKIAILILNNYLDLAGAWAHGHYNIYIRARLTHTCIHACTPHGTSTLSIFPKSRVTVHAHKIINRLWLQPMHKLLFEFPACAYETM